MISIAGEVVLLILVVTIGVVDGVLRKFIKKFKRKFCCCMLVVVIVEILDLLSNKGKVNEVCLACVNKYFMILFIHFIRLV